MTKNEFVQLLFPTGVVNHGTEVNGLIKGTEPQNCIILDRWQDTTDEFRREFFLVKNEEYIALLRVCKAGDYVKYDEFAVIQKIALLTAVAEARAIVELNERWRQSLAK